MNAERCGYCPYLGQYIRLGKDSTAHLYGECTACGRSLLDWFICPQDRIRDTIRKEQRMTGYVHSIDPVKDAERYQAWLDEERARLDREEKE